MSNKKKQEQEPLNPDEAATQATCGTAPEETVQDVEQPSPFQAELDAMKAAVAEQEDKFLRLAAEYDNFRRRTQKEKDSIWSDAKAETAAAFFSVYDNLERALKQETCDEAYRKGVEMTMTGLNEVLGKLGITEIPALGEPFDPNLHNAVMHIEDESLGENMIAEVFQTGFISGEKVIRFAMVKVAN